MTAGDLVCATCQTPVTGAGPPAPDETPANRENVAPDTSDTSWDAVVERLRLATIGEYEILSELGRGGMAAVFLAHEHGLNRKVALKVMSPGMMMAHGMVERFYTEAVTQANLVHPHIVGVHAVRNAGDLHFFVMQFVPGRTLQRVLQVERVADRVLPFDVVLALLYQSGSAVAYAHRRGVIHRDLKPGNIMLNGDGDAVVTDFGIAKVTEAPSQTMTGTVVGTPAYMSPEQCFASDLTPASDQYSLGIVAYELLCGRTPFEGKSFAIMQAHTMQEPPPLGERRPDCPPELEAAVLRMLAKKPADRFPNIDEALHALGAEAPSMAAGNPLRRELQRLADVTGVHAKLADVLRGPMSPAPRTRSGAARALPSESAPAPPKEAPALAEQVFRTPQVPQAPPPSPVEPTATTPSPSRRWWLAGGAAVAAVALGFWIATRDTAPPNPLTEPEQPREVPATTQANKSTAAGLDISSPPRGGSTTAAATPAAPPAAQPRPQSQRAPAAGAREPAEAAEAKVSPRTGDPTATVDSIDRRPRPTDSVVGGTATKTSTPARDSVVAVAPPSEAQLISEAEQRIRALVSVISSKDTSELRRAFPTAPKAWLSQWQSLFESAGQVESTLLGINTLGSPSATDGSSSRFRVRQRVALRGGRVVGNRFDSEFTVVLRRERNAWVVAGIDQ